MAANDEPIDDEELLALTKIHFHPSGKPNRTAIAHARGRSEAGIPRALARIARRGLLTHLTAAMPGFEITKVTSKQDDGSYVTQKPEADDLKDKIPEGHI